MEGGEKIHSVKLKIECDLNVTTRTIQRYMKRINMKYQKVPTKIILNKEHKKKRLNIIRNWIINNHRWDKTIFSDEKKFNLDGPDSWKSYMEKENKIFRGKRQCGGSSVMVWMMVLPNGLLSFQIIEGHFNSIKYINLLCKFIVPIIKLNFGDNVWFQEDNSPIHKSKIVKNFMFESKINVLAWPARSPDLNIAEDVWKRISDAVYDGPQFKNRHDLIKKIKEVIFHINSNERQVILNLYKTIQSRLCCVLEKQGNLCNK